MDEGHVEITYCMWAYVSSFTSASPSIVSPVHSDSEVRKRRSSLFFSGPIDSTYFLTLVYSTVSSLPSHHNWLVLRLVLYCRRHQLFLEKGSNKVLGALGCLVHPETSCVAVIACSSLLCTRAKHLFFCWEEMGPWFVKTSSLKGIHGRLQKWPKIVLKGICDQPNLWNGQTLCFLKSWKTGEYKDSQCGVCKH